LEQVQKPSLLRYNDDMSCESPILQKQESFSLLQIASLEKNMRMVQLDTTRLLNGTFRKRGSKLRLVCFEFVPIVEALLLRPRHCECDFENLVNWWLEWTESDESVDDGFSFT